MQGQQHKPGKIARSLAEAGALGHQNSSRPSQEDLGRGVYFAPHAPAGQSAIARTLAEARALGHRNSVRQPTQEELGRGVHFAAPATAAQGTVCWVGLCDPNTHTRQVAYLDDQGNCNVFVTAPC
jgi:hypothetical protein